MSGAASSGASGTGASAMPRRGDVLNVGAGCSTATAPAGFTPAGSGGARSRWDGASPCQLSLILRRVQSRSFTC